MLLILLGSRLHLDGAPQFESQHPVLVGCTTYLAGVVVPHDGAGELRRRGYHIVSSGTNVVLFRNAAVEDVRKFNMN